jgi:probable HAF family extracellular repeat protein
MRDLGTLAGCAPSEATAMNNHREVVGSADLCSSGPPSRAFLFSGGGMFDLNDLVPPAADGFVFATARGINDRGTIVGIATSPGGFSSRPFLLLRDGEEDED